jgi:hypothetical protein
VVAEAEDAPADSYAATILNDHPIAYWRMDITTGTVIKDETGNQHDLVLQGSGWTLGAPGAISGSPSVHFDGANAYAIVQPTPAFQFETGKAFSIECWLQWDGPDATTAYGDIVSHYDPFADDGGSIFNGINLYIQNGQTVFGASCLNCDGGSGLGLKGAMPSGYYHLVATFDTTAGGSLYINGKESGPVPAQPFAMPVTGPLTVAAQPRGGGTFFAGSLDEIAVYDHALSIQQVQEHLLRSGH